VGGVSYIYKLFSFYYAVVGINIVNSFIVRNMDYVLYFYSIIVCYVLIRDINISFTFIPTPNPNAYIHECI
jgi:hypothetical protein